MKLGQKLTSAPWFIIVLNFKTFLSSITATETLVRFCDHNRASCQDASHCVVTMIHCFGNQQDQFFISETHSISSPCKKLLFVTFCNWGNFAEFAKHWKKWHNKKESMCVQYMLQVKIISRLKFFSLGWFSISFLSPSPNYSWIRARRRRKLRISLGKEMLTWI